MPEVKLQWFGHPVEIVNVGQVKIKHCSCSQETQGLAWVGDDEYQLCCAQESGGLNPSSRRLTLRTHDYPEES